MRERVIICLGKSKPKKEKSASRPATRCCGRRDGESIKCAAGRPLGEVTHSPGGWEHTNRLNGRLLPRTQERWRPRHLIHPKEPDLENLQIIIALTLFFFIIRPGSTHARDTRNETAFVWGRSVPHEMYASNPGTHIFSGKGVIWSSDNAVLYSLDWNRKNGRRSSQKKIRKGPKTSEGKPMALLLIKFFL